MADSSKAKTLYLVELTLEKWFREVTNTYFLTFTLPPVPEGGVHLSKDEVEVMFKPFRDYCSRRGVRLLVVWERQKRGAWHPHCLVDKRLDVAVVRPFMVARGWGSIMKFLYLRQENSTIWDPSDPTKPIGSERHTPGAAKISRYLTKYLTKSMREVAGCARKKVFSAPASVKAGTIGFKWVPWVKPGAMLYAAGLAIFLSMEGRMPFFSEMPLVIRLGVENSGWAEVDPWWQFGFP